MVRRPADAENVAQEALLRAFAAVASCREPAKFAPWLFVIVRNHARNWLARRKHRDVTAEDNEEPAAEDASPVSTRDQLTQALATLTDLQREVVLLHDLEGLTHGEIAPVVGCSEGMSRQHLLSARRSMRAALSAASNLKPESEVPHAEEHSRSRAVG